MKIEKVDPDEFTIAKAKRDNEYGLFAFWGPTGCGKTKSALIFAEGLVSGTKKRIGMIDTENGRGSHYAGEHDFDVLQLIDPYTPERYLAAILKFEKEGYGACIVDSMSHEWNGEGGLEDIQNDALVRMCTKDGVFDSAKAERLTALAWKEPKRRHKKMMVRLLQRKMHIIFCLRAEQKVKFVKTKTQGSSFEKTEIVDAGFLPICEKGFMFEMTLSAKMLAKDSGGEPGVPIFSKIEGQHLEAFGDKQIDREAGELMAKWCRGESIAAAAPPKPVEKKAQTPAVAPPTDNPPTDDFPGDRKSVGAATVTFSLIDSKGSDRGSNDPDEWLKRALALFTNCKDDRLEILVNANRENIDKVQAEGWGLKATKVRDLIKRRQTEKAGAV